MNWGWIKKGLANIVFYVLAIFLFIWTMSLTTSIVGEILPEPWWSRYFAVILFDGGLLAWLFVFMELADGLPQRTISIVCVLMDLIGLSIVAFAELFLGGQQLVTVPKENLGMTAIAVIGIWTIINVIGIVIFHLSNPKTMEEISKRIAEDKIKAKSLELLNSRADQIADLVAKELSDNMVDSTLVSLGASKRKEEYQPAALPVTNASNIPLIASNNGAEVEERNFTSR